MLRVTIDKQTSQHPTMQDVIKYLGSIERAEEPHERHVHVKGTCERGGKYALQNPLWIMLRDLKFHTKYLDLIDKESGGTVTFQGDVSFIATNDDYEHINHHVRKYGIRATTAATAIQARKYADELLKSKETEEEGKRLAQNAQSLWKLAKELL